jgi:hypothetical protein
MFERVPVGKRPIFASLPIFTFQPETAFTRSCENYRNLMNVLAPLDVFRIFNVLWTHGPCIPLRDSLGFMTDPIQWRGSNMESFWLNISSSPGTNVSQCPMHLDLSKERIRRRIQHNKHARSRETPSIAEIVGRIAAIILVIAVCAQAMSR